ncbi:ribosomal protein S6 kinase alpha-4-like isoform X1 [Sitodiplosis mosellana]|uniref:ribosomal protein S6 kinase alpha-4-like isoform X1 n=1 Tax=Sitodiplosis mosellana TaxID=263140 RepID=UPI00244532E2|nr:ribosomal protein S6 kinase alpha-4-like isoform X1 [Sitodiplosis mosellana]
MSADSTKSLTVFHQIDEGSFGQIFLVRKNGGLDDGKTYAMKSIRSNPEIEDQHNICRNELKVLKLVWGIPFFVQLKYALKTRHHYHMVMDYMPAGNLFNFLQSGTLTLAETTICCAEIVLAIEYLHEQRFVYRDLKLENILISRNNHIVIADFGLTRKIQDDERLTDEAGTVAYFAPVDLASLDILLEMLDTNKGHSFEVDWWSLGIIAFELLVGHTPFLASIMEGISDRVHRNRIQKEQPRLDKLHGVNQNVKIVTDFIEKLLIKDPEQRLGAGQTGYEAVKKHAFFSQLNWLAVQMKVYECLKRSIPVQDIPIDYDQQYEISLEEPQEQRRKQFYYIAPELQRQPTKEWFYGFTEEDLNALPGPIPLPPPVYDIQLSSDLFIRTTTPAETIKKIILSKKVVSFREEENTSPTRTEQQNGDYRYSPYPTNTDSALRRSERMASKRTKRSYSFCC